MHGNGTGVLLMNEHIHTAKRPLDNKCDLVIKILLFVIVLNFAMTQ